MTPPPGSPPGTTWFLRDQAELDTLVAALTAICNRGGECDFGRRAVDGARALQPGHGPADAGVCRRF